MIKDAEKSFPELQSVNSDAEVETEVKDEDRTFEYNKDSLIDS